MATTFTGQHAAHLPEDEQRLLHFMRWLQFGRIENLHIKERQVVLEPAPRLIETVRIGPQRPFNVVGWDGDYELRQSMIDLLELLRSVGNGVVPLIVVKHGLPHLVELDRAEFLRPVEYVDDYCSDDLGL